VFTIGQQIDHIIRHHTGDDHETPAAKRGMVQCGGIARPQAVYDTYPHRLSGGMQQR
jgi:ABC-type dipeptide/oligopeptide/nickel transport system ATPase component